MQQRHLILTSSVSLLALFLLTGIILNQGITGYAFAEFYDTQVMYTINAIAGEQMTFVIPINNEQNETLRNVYAEIEVTDSEGNTIVTINTEPQNVDPYTKTEIHAIWENSVLPGTYRAHIYLHEETADASFTKNFIIEARTITIESIQVEDFELGETINLDILVQNYLDQPIEDATANILIYTPEETIITTITTASMMLNASTITKLPASWDTQNLNPGTYNVQVLITAGGYEARKDIVFTIGQNSFTVTGVGFAVNYTQQNTYDTIIMGLIITVAIITINIILWKLYQKKNK